MNTFKLPKLAAILGCILILIPASKAGVVDYWRFEEGDGTNVADQTGLANGTLSSANLWSTDVPDPFLPQTGQPDHYSVVMGNYLGGINYVEAAPNATITLTNFTIELFFNMIGGLPYYTIYDPYHFIAMYDHILPSGISIDMGEYSPFDQDTGLFGLGVQVNANDGAFADVGSQFIPAGNLSGWHHLAFVDNGGVGTIYLDGVSVGSGTVPGPVTLTTNSSFYAGYDAEGNATYAELDEIRLTNTALDPSKFLNAAPARPSVSAMNLAGKNVSLTFPTLPYRFYTVQSSINPVAGPWSTIASNIVGTGAATNWIDPGAAALPQKFYRIGLTAPTAADNAADPGYSGGWTNFTSGGIGFSPWVLSATSTNITNDGFFLGSSVSNAFAKAPGIDIAGQSWGLYANTSNDATAYRAFNSLAVGDTFKVDMDNGFIDSGNSVGFVLRNGNATNYNTNARFEFLFLGGGSSYAVVDAGGYNPINVPFTGTGLHLVFNLGTNDTYTFTVIDNASSATDTVVNGTLSGTPGSTIDSIALYNRNAGSGSAADAFFNSMQITGP